MKKLLFILVGPIILFGYKNPGLNDSNLSGINQLAITSGVFYKALTKRDAERILGQTVKLTMAKKEKKDDVVKISITYTGLENEAGSNRQVNLHYSLTKYTDLGLATKAYALILKNNMGMPGQTLIKELGDEALYHSDDKNFSLIIVRKNENLLLIKINKQTKKFAKDELLKITEGIVSKI